MQPWKTNSVHDLLAAAIRENDMVTIMRILTEQIESTEGEEKAYWLGYRATVKLSHGRAENRQSAEADLTEAGLAYPDDVQINVSAVLYQALNDQRLDLLAKIPRNLRSVVRSELFGEWHFWHNIAYLHRLRRRFHQSYRAYARALNLYRNMSPEELRNKRGWAIPLNSQYARAALRVGQMEEAVAAVATATEVDGETVRKHMNPCHLALAQAEVAFGQGDNRGARWALQVGMSRLAEYNHRITPVFRIQIDLVAARMARAEGNLLAFQNFCEKALTTAIESKLVLYEAEVRAIMNGALW